MARRHWLSAEQLSLGNGLGMDTDVHQIDEAGEHGEVFTRRWIVELILDLSGYTADRDLAAMLAVEPSSRRAVEPSSRRVAQAPSSCRWWSDSSTRAPRTVVR